jgi:hypothetical protein
MSDTLDDIMEQFGGVKRGADGLEITDENSENTDTSNIASDTENSSNPSTPTTTKKLKSTIMNNTFINVPENTPIFTFSDIHADIHALIIALRDCAKVIRKKVKKVTDGLQPFNPDRPDDDMERLLLLDINPTSPLGSQIESYKEDLGYEWTGGDAGNAQVVIIGDIIDGFRDMGKSNVSTRKILNHVNRTQPVKALEHEYPQIELKILMFLNALIKQALQKKETEGRIGMLYKVLGNHEVMQILRTRGSESYVMPNDKGPNYYDGIPRDRIFEINNFGFKLIFKYGCFALLKINNNIFVHGQLIGLNSEWDPKSREYRIINGPIDGDKYGWDFVMYNDINKNLRSENIKDIRYALEELDNVSNSQVWFREFGSHLHTDRRLRDSLRHPEKRTEELFCENVQHIFDDFAKLLPSTDLYRNPNNFRLIIGHCIQSEASKLYKTPDKRYYINYINQSFTNVLEQDPQIEVLGPPSTIGTSDPKYKDPNSTGLIFGITMECPNDEANSIHKIYKVDIGSSRSFDNQYDIQTIEHRYDDIPIDGIPQTDENRENTQTRERRYLYSRTPQVLEIKNNDMKIIRSKIKNTRIHQQRPSYEGMVDNLDSHGRTILKLDNPSNIHYQQKYLKYKKKYIELKNKINKMQIK